MSVPAPITLYMTNMTATQAGIASTACNHGAMTASAPTVPATTAWGWNVGTLAAPRCNQMDFGVEVSRTATTPPWQTTSRPTLRPPSSSFGDCWVYGPLEGEFDQTPWYVTQSVKSVSLAGTQLGRFVFVLYKAANAQGSGSSVISASYINSASTAVTDSMVYTSICTSLAATTNQARCTQSFMTPRTFFRNEYLLLQTHWAITTAGGGNNADVDWIIGANSASLKTSNFIAYSMQAAIHHSDDFG